MKNKTMNIILSYFTSAQQPKTSSESNSDFRFLASPITSKFRKKYGSKGVNALFVGMDRLYLPL